MPKMLEQLRPLLGLAGEQLPRCLLTDDRRGALSLLAANVREALSAESCSVFLIPEGEPDCLLWAGGAPETIQASQQNLRLPIKHFHESEWLGEAANDRRPVVLSSEALAIPAQPDSRARRRSGLGPFRSVLAVPLIDGKEQCQGVIEVVNKQGDGAAFSEQDVANAQTMAQFMAWTVYGFQVLSVLRNEYPTLTNANNLDDLYQVILRVAMQIFEADRGDLVVWDPLAKDLIVRTSHGTPGPKQVPPRCIVRRVWESGLPSCIENVLAEGDYCALDDHVRSELAIRWQVNGQPFGVLNLESRRLGHFSQLDLDLLHWLSRGAAVFHQYLGKQIHIRHLVQAMAETSPTERETLQTILRSVADLFSFESCQIYLLSADGKSLELADAFGCPTFQFSYSMDDQALVTEVIRKKKGLYVPLPHDLKLVNPRGISTFGIRSPLVGVPLVFRDQAVGTLVAWNNKNPEAVQERHVQELEQFARVAAANIALSATARRRELVLEAHQNVQRAIHEKKDLDASLDLIMQNIQQIAGFDRVRIYEYRDSTESFECRAWCGMGKDFHGCVIPIKGSRYARKIYETAQEGPSVLYFDPTSHEFGEDPHGEALGRSAHQPWVVWPLKINGSMCGQIAADNATTRREITKESQDTLSILGGLAAQAFANDRLDFEARSGRGLRALIESLIIDDPKPAILRRLLVYATSGHALGFSRAIFLEKKEGSKRLEYSSGIGSIEEQRHGHVIGTAVKQTLQDLLAGATKFDDAGLVEAVQDFTIDITDQAVTDLLYLSPGVKIFSARERGQWPGWVEELARRTRADELLVGRVGDERDSFGLLVVDRCWQKRDLSAADVRAVEMFAQHIAALVLRQHDLHRQILESRELAVFGFLGKSLAHDLKQPIGVLRNDPKTLVEALIDRQYDLARNCALRIDHQVARLSEMVRDLEVFLRPEQGFAPTGVRELLAAACAYCQERADSLGVQLGFDLDEQLAPARPRLNPGLLRQGLRNLISNSLDAFERKTQGGTIKVRGDLLSDWLVLSVADDGAGMNAENLDKARRQGVGFTSKEEQAKGFGLDLVRHVAQAHKAGGRRGDVLIDSAPGRGTRVQLLLPR